LSEKVNEGLLNLLGALTNLSPSRNTISQLIFLLPEELALVERSYPEMVSRDPKKILESLGIRFGDKVERTQNGFAEALHENIHRVFDWLDDELICAERESLGADVVFVKMDEVRSSLAKLTGAHIDVIPNPYKEWAKLVLRKLSNLYGKDKVLKLLKVLLDHTYMSEKDYKWKVLEELFKKLRAEIAASPPELDELQRFVIFAEGESELLYSKGTSRHPQGDLWIEHSKYHLDPFICESYIYGNQTNYTYRLRHKESLSEALREAYA